MKSGQNEIGADPANRDKKAPPFKGAFVPLDADRDIFRMLSGQRFSFVGLTPYVRKDGSPTELAHWQTFCPVCGEAFTATTPSEAVEFNPTRRCVDCRRPGRISRGQIRRGGQS